jgi:hypothetical protein
MNNGLSRPPISPMSRDVGSQLNPMPSCAGSKAWAIKQVLKTKLPWVSITPFGEPVEPERVLQHRHIAGARMSPGGTCPRRLGASDSSPPKSNCGSRGASSSNPSCIRSVTSLTVNATFAAQSSEIVWIRSMLRLRRGG